MLQRPVERHAHLVDQSLLRRSRAGDVAAALTGRVARQPSRGWARLAIQTSAASSSRHFSKPLCASTTCDLNGFSLRFFPGPRRSRPRHELLLGRPAVLGARRRVKCECSASDTPSRRAFRRCMPESSPLNCGSGQASAIKCDRELHSFSDPPLNGPNECAGALRARLLCLLSLRRWRDKCWTAQRHTERAHAAHCSGGLLAGSA